MLPRIIAVAASIALIAGVAGCGGDGLYHYRVDSAEGGGRSESSMAKPAWWDNPAVVYCDDPKAGAVDYDGATDWELLESYCKISGP